MNSLAVCGQRKREDAGIGKAVTVALLLLFCLLFHGRTAPARNLHLIEELPNGFKLYRSGTPSKADLKEFHALGIREIAVLSGDADKRELRYPHLVPDLEVVYNETQKGSKPLTASFLRWFDQWVGEARAEGKVIAFRCRCGCHRTGRLAAYYQMKYRSLSVEQALDLMGRRGKKMFLHGHLWLQVRALEDYIHGRPCSQKRKYCVVEDNGKDG
jgi:hypothetical protein